MKHSSCGKFAGDSIEMSFFIASYPSAMLTFGFALFYSQITLGWWSPGSWPANLFLLISSAAVLAIGAGLAVYLGGRFFNQVLREANESIILRRLALGGMAVLGGFILIMLFSDLKPAHLIQESDFLNYHLLLPKQFWLKRSWAPVIWSDFEFLHLSNQYGLSYLWLGLPMLNKLPQFLLVTFFILRAWLLCVVLAPRQPFLAGLTGILAFFAFRGVAIQVGTAMLDLPFLYFLAGLALGLVRFLRDEVKSTRWCSLIVGIDLAAYLGQKSFSIIFLAALVLAATALAYALIGKKKLWVVLGRMHLGWVAAPVFLLWFPTAVRSFYFTGDPLYPVFPVLAEMFCQSSRLVGKSCESLSANAHKLFIAVQQYGYGMNPLAFLKSFFLVPLAWDGPSPVNNRFDYPLGLAWYLVWARVATDSFRGSSRTLRRHAMFALLLSGFFYCVWFVGSQQSRWLYPVILALAVSWGVLLENVPPKRRMVYMALTITMLCVNGARVIRSQRHSLACFGESCLASNSRYWEDYHRSCSKDGEEVEIDDRAERGYLNCRIVLGAKSH